MAPKPDQPNGCGIKVVAALALLAMASAILIPIIVLLKLIF